MSEFKTGQRVAVEGEEGIFTIVKVMTQTAKIERDGKTSIKPFAMLSHLNQNGGNNEKLTAPVDKTGKPASRRRPVAPPEEKPKKNTPHSKTPAQKAKAKAKKTAYVKPDEEDDGYDGPVTQSPPSPSAPRHYARNKGDVVSKYLDDADTTKKLETAVRKHPAFGFINEKSFRETLKKASSLQFGLLRMRMGNLIRGAINRSKKKAK